MELTVANDFQNNLHQITVVSMLSHLAGILDEVDYLHSPHKNMETLEKILYDIMGKSH